MSARPKIKLKLSPVDWLFDFVSIGLILFMWVLVLYMYNSQSDTIATHFDLTGKPNGYGSKQTLLGVPSIATASCILLFVLNRFPHSFNYPVTITEENAALHYSLATRTMRMMNVCMTLIFLFVLLVMLPIGSNLRGWILPVVLLSFVPVIWYFIKLKKIRTTGS